MDQILKKINTLTELQEERAKLRREIDINKVEFFRSLDTTKSQAKNVILKGLVLPAGLISLTVAGVKAVRALRNGKEQAEPEEYLHYNGNPPGIVESIKSNLESNPKWYIRLLPVAIELVSTFLTIRNNNNNNHDENEDLENHHYYPNEVVSVESR